LYSAEQQLLDNIRNRLPDLEALLDRATA